MLKRVFFIVIALFAIVLMSCEQQDRLIEDQNFDNQEVNNSVAYDRSSSCSYPYEGEDLGSGNQTFFDLEPGKYYHKIDCGSSNIFTINCRVIKISGQGTVIARTVLENDIAFSHKAEWEMIYSCTEVTGGNQVKMGPFSSIASKWDNLYFEIIIEEDDATVSLNTSW